MSSNFNFTTIGLQGNEVFELFDYQEVYKTPLHDLSKTNVFIGSNNSGKSLFLRTLFCDSIEKYETKSLRLKTLKSEIEGLIQVVKQELRDFYIKVHQVSVRNVQIFQDLKNSIDMLDLSHNTIDSVSRLKKQILSFSEQSAFNITTDSGESHFQDGDAYYSTFKRSLEKIVSHIENVSLEHPPSSYNRVYIPILRGLRPLNDGTNHDSYGVRTNRDYFKNGSSLESIKGLSVFTGLSLYERLRDQLLGEPEERKRVRDFEVFLSREFFKDQEVTLIPQVTRDVVAIKIGDEPQEPIFNVGDGLQQLIVLTYPIFTSEKRTLFFIEEPELSMHPGMQRKFLEVLNTDAFAQHQYFLTTHSNHLLDMTLDYNNTSVYLFRKKVSDEKKFYIDNVSNTDLNILRAIGAKSSSVFLTNATIWVEGITDRLYLRAYLKKYMNDYLSEGESFFQEDKHFSFVEYQGSNLVHWDFGENVSDKRISANYIVKNSYLVADGDVTSKGNRVDKYKSMLGTNFHVTSGKEVENLIPQELLRSVVEDEFRSKSKEIGKVLFDEYSTSQDGIGKYLDSIYLSNGDSKPHYATETGTIKSKVHFCQQVLEVAESGFTWKLSGETLELCKKIYEFIKAHN